MPISEQINFCPLPFAHTMLDTTGTYQICCQHTTPLPHQLNIREARLDQWKKSAYVEEVKRSFINNQQHPGCNNCWQTESLEQTSYRQLVANDYISIFKVNHNTDHLVDVELQLGNLCNLTCLMCNESASSAILAENKRLGVNRHDQSEFVWGDSTFDNLKHLLDLEPNTLTIRGGEPLYNKLLLNLLEQLPEQVCRKMMLHITTNATVWNDRWANTIKKFKLVRFMFSLDATKDLFEYIRFPGQWALVENNVKHISKINNVKPLIHCTVQNLNIGRIGDIIRWSMEQNIWLNFFQLIDPPHFYITVLPLSHKARVLEHLDDCLAIPQLPAHLENFISSCRSQIIESLSTQQDHVLWQQCLDYLEPRDTLRGNSHRTVFTY